MDEPEVQLAEQAKINNSQHDLKSGREKPKRQARGAWVVPTPPRKTTLILVQRKDKHASDHRRRQMQHTHLQSGKEEKESSGSHPEMMFLIGFRRYEGYRYMGGRKRKWSRREGKKSGVHNVIWSEDQGPYWAPTPAYQLRNIRITQISLTATSFWSIC